MWIISTPLLAAPVRNTPMTADQLDCLQKMIYFNECSGKAERMITWNADETFPSFGIGHFIWYPAGNKGPYKELFPEFLSFLEAQKEAIPLWITALPAREAPWPTRDAFLADISSERMTSLKSFLKKTKNSRRNLLSGVSREYCPECLRRSPKLSGRRSN